MDGSETKYTISALFLWWIRYPIFQDAGELPIRNNYVAQNVNNARNYEGN